MNETLEHLLDGGDLEEHEADALMVELADPAFDPAVAGALLAALRAKGETADEVRGFARGMRRLATRPVIRDDVPAIDQGPAPLEQHYPAKKFAQFGKRCKTIRLNRLRRSTQQAGRLTGMWRQDPVIFSVRIISQPVEPVRIHHLGQVAPLHTAPHHAPPLAAP